MSKRLGACAMCAGMLAGLVGGNEAEASSYECSAIVQALVPSEDAVDVPVDVQLVVANDEECTSLTFAQIVLAGPSGEVPVTVEVEHGAAIREIATVIPDAPLEPDSAYTLTVSGEAATEIAFETGAGTTAPLPEVSLSVEWVSLTYPDIGHTGGDLLHHAAIEIAGIPSDLAPGTTLILRRSDVTGDAVFPVPAADGSLAWSMRTNGDAEVCVEVALRAANGVESPPSNLACRVGDPVPVEDDDDGQDAKGCSVVDDTGAWSVLSLALLALGVRRGRRRGAGTSGRSCCRGDHASEVGQRGRSG